MAKQCGYSSPFDQWRCPAEATTEDGLCIFHDPSPTKDIQTLKVRLRELLAVEKEDPLRFDGSIFPDGVSFNGVVFERSISFREAQFHGQATFFLGTRFHGPRTCFDQAQFRSRWTFFERAQFYGEVTSFDRAQFYGEATLRRTQFRSKRTSFVEAEFHGQRTSFEGAQFHGQTIFRGDKPAQVFFGGTTDFKEISVGKEGELVFDWVDLSRTQFLHADISRVKFLDVRWNHPLDEKADHYQWGGWRSRIYDEALWREARRPPNNTLREDIEYLPHLGRLYRALKAYYRETGENRLVGHFQYGLMEVQWYQKEAEWAIKGGPWLKRKWKKWVSWEAAYRYSSGYGEDYAWAGLVLVGFLVLFAGCYWLLGVPETWGEWWERGLRALLYSFQAGIPSRVRFYQEPTVLAARYLHVVESILVPVQFGFFLFAMRNRFRR